MIIIDVIEEDEDGLLINIDRTKQRHLEATRVEERFHFSSKK